MKPKVFLPFATVLAIAMLCCTDSIKHGSQDEFNEMLLRAASGETEVAAKSLSLGAHVNTTDSMGITPLMWAAYKGKRSTVQLLLEKGADVDHCNRDGYTALRLARLRNRNTVVSLLEEWDRRPAK